MTTCCKCKVGEHKRHFALATFTITFFVMSSTLYLTNLRYTTLMRDATAGYSPFIQPMVTHKANESTKSIFPTPDELFNETLVKLHLMTRSQGSQSKFLQASEPTDRYIININNTGPLMKVEELFTSVGKLSCFKIGLNMSAVRSMPNVAINQLKNCPCLHNYYGSQCSIPGCVYKVPKNKKVSFRLLSDARRVVMGIVVNHELEMTEIRIRTLADVVDVFIIAESNISASGDTKPLYFFEAFKRGFLEEFHHKILYIYQDWFPPGYVEDGWKADRYIRTYMSQHGMPRITGLSPEDIFLNCDADEIPKAETVLFLKLHSGFHQPIRINFRHTLYGYFYAKVIHGQQNMNTLATGSTIQYLSEVCKGDAMLIRRANSAGHDITRSLEIGVLGDFGGHHCSWCFSASGIRHKLVAAQKADRPRWGDYPEKLKLDYIESLRRTGSWFDGTTRTIKTDEKLVPDFAPRYVMEHRERYRELLVHPDVVKLLRK